MAKTKKKRRKNTSKNTNTNGNNSKKNSNVVRVGAFILALVIIVSLLTMYASI